MAILKVGNVINVMLLMTNGADDGVRKARIVSDVDDFLGLHMLVIVEPGQGVSYARQTLQADYNPDKRRWQVMHPCT